VSLASPALAAVLRTWPSQTAATFAKTRLLDLLSAAVEQQRRMHADQVLVAQCLWARHGPMPAFRISSVDSEHSAYLTVVCRETAEYFVNICIQVLSNLTQ